MSVIVLKDEQGEPYGLAGFAEDITHRKRAEEELQEANRRLKELATTDELTGLWNRRRFAEILALELERAKRRHAPLALAMFDIDQFKSINDTYGHAMGDRVLKEAAKTIQGGARGTDVVARYGGDEFMIVMPDATAEEAVSAAERVRKQMAGRQVSDGTQTIRVSLSAGISAFDPAAPVLADALVHEADGALYAAKHSGRDCTRTAGQVAETDVAETAVNAQAIAGLRQQVAALSQRSREAFMQGVRSLVQAQEARDPFAKTHSENIARFAAGIAQAMRVDANQVAVIHRAALLHDIGTIGVPDGILWKPGPLTPEERMVMQQHVLIGVKILDRMRLLDREVPIVRHHHERWDGHGYPDGISGEAIPLGARILAVADAFDAITSDRPYRQARPVAEALKTLQEEAGRQFDPRVVDALVQWVRGTVEAGGGEADLTVEDLVKQGAAAPA
jgi:diguanylate cyclase (GGDEF)-like protein/putative nucleotidyltransferase with HDIG domain